MCVEQRSGGPSQITHRGRPHTRATLEGRPNPMLHDSALTPSLHAHETSLHSPSRGTGDPLIVPTWTENKKAHVGVPPSSRGAKRGQLVGVVEHEPTLPPSIRSCLSCHAMTSPASFCVRGATQNGGHRIRPIAGVRTPKRRWRDAERGPSQMTQRGRPHTQATLEGRPSAMLHDSA